MTFEHSQEALVLEASKLFPGAGVAIYIWDGILGLLTPGADNPVARADGPAPRAPGIGASGRAFQEKQQVLITRYATEVGHATPAGRAGVLSAMSMPLTSGTRIVGAVSIGTEDPSRTFSSDDLRVLARVLAESGWSESPRLEHGQSQGRLAELETMYDIHHRMAFSLAARLLGDYHQAEEVIQDVFLAAWRSSAQYQPGRGSQRTWIMSMVRNRSIDLLRARRRQPPSVADSSAMEHLPSADDIEPIAAHIDGLNVHLALERLPVDQRQALQLAYFGELSHREIAEILDVPLGTIKGRIRLGLDRLRAFLGPPAADAP